MVSGHACATAVLCHSAEKTTGRQRGSTTFLGCSLMASIALDHITQTAVNCTNTFILSERGASSCALDRRAAAGNNRGVESRFLSVKEGNLQRRARGGTTW